MLMILPQILSLLPCMTLSTSQNNMFCYVFSVFMVGMEQPIATHLAWLDDLTQATELARSLAFGAREYAPIECEFHNWDYPELTNSVYYPIF